MGSLGQKITRLVALVIIGLMASFSSVWAIPVATVGDVDEFVGFCNGTPAGIGNEIICIESLGGVSVTAAQKFSSTPDLLDGELQLTLEAVDGLDDTYAFLLPEAWRGSHFILKTGNLTPGSGGPTILSYLFENLSSTAYAVFNINSSLDDDNPFPFEIGQTGKISHLTAIQVLATPLPAAAWMLLSALGGIFGFRRLSLRRKTV